jgi:hypothetical protein
MHTPPGGPDFTGNGGDSIEYAWFLWDDQPLRVVWLNTENVEKAKPVSSKCALTGWVSPDRLLTSIAARYGCP